MQSVKIVAPGRVVVEEQPMPVVGPDDVLVKIHYVGFCGSDLNTFRGKNPMAIDQVIPGHEIGGTVEDVGSNVPAGLFEKGMSVTVNPYTACGKCSSCRRGRPNACRHNETLGVQRHGAMSDYIAVPWSKIIPAQGLTPRECALVEPMSVGFHAVDRGQVTDIDTVAVIGCGMIGLGAIVRASLRGATVIAIDLDDEKLALARELGATYSINSATMNLADELNRLTDGNGPDVVIEAVGSPFTYVAAVDNVAFCGRVVCIGYAKDDVSFHTKLFVQKELDIRGSRNAMPNDFAAVIRYFLAGGRDNAEKLISDTVTPDQAGEALEKWSANPGKVFRILVKF